jgi:hypothetical protein
MNILQNENENIYYFIKLTKYSFKANNAFRQSNSVQSTDVYQTICVSL